MSYPISELQRDTLIEIFNIGVGRAAHSLSQIVQEEVKLSVPSLRILSFREAPRANLGIDSEHVCAVSQRFSSQFDAEAMLIFPEGKTQEIVRRMLGESITAEELNQMEQEALSEIGNIILNACISAFSSLFGSEFTSTLPVYHLGTPEETIGKNVSIPDDLLMLLHIDFALPRDQINGYLVFLLDLPSFQLLLEQVDRYLAQLPGKPCTLPSLVSITPKFSAPLQIR